MRHIIFRFILLLATVSVALGGCARREKRAARGEAGRPELVGPNLTIIRGVERQPFVSQVGRVIEAMRHIGSPIALDDLETIYAAMKNDDDAETIEAIQKVLNKYCLIGVHIKPRKSCEADTRTRPSRVGAKRVARISVPRP